MKIKEKLDELLAKLPEGIDPEKLSKQIEAHEKAVRIIGGLLTRDENSLTVQVGDRRLKIALEDIIQVEETSSAPAVGVVGIFVELMIQPTANIVESRETQASMLGSHIGKRPFVYELPSHASEHAVAAEELERANANWRASVGLGDYPEMIASSPTPYLSSDPSTFQTSYTTVTQTKTPGDTNVDKPLDYKTDSKTDFKSDYKTDP